MNIFYLSESPSEAAQSLCDVHLRKMIVETCQLLQTHDILHGKERKWKPFGENHPCRRALEKKQNYNWLRVYLTCLLEEYEYRFGKSHKCKEIRDAYYKVGFFQKFYILGNLELEDFPQVMPEECKVHTDFGWVCNSRDAYRNYYRYKKNEFMKKGIKWSYTKRKEPAWMLV